MIYKNTPFYVFKRKQSESILYSQKEAHVQQAKTLTIYLSPQNQGQDQNSHHHQNMWHKCDLMVTYKPTTE